MASLVGMEWICPELSEWFWVEFETCHRVQKELQAERRLVAQRGK